MKVSDSSVGEGGTYEDIVDMYLFTAVEQK